MQAHLRADPFECPGHRLELTTVDRDQAVGEQVELATQQDELTAGRLDGRNVVAAEVGDGLEVRREPARQLKYKAFASVQPST